MTREAALQVFDALVANGFQAAVSAGNANAADGPQYYVSVTGQMLFTERDIELLMTIARSSGQELEVLLPPNTPTGVGITSPKDRPLELRLANEHED